MIHEKNMNHYLFPSEGSSQSQVSKIDKIWREKKDEDGSHLVQTH